MSRIEQYLRQTRAEPPISHEHKQALANRLRHEIAGPILDEPPVWSLRQSAFALAASLCLLILMVGFAATRPRATAKPADQPWADMPELQLALPEAQQPGRAPGLRLRFASFGLPSHYSYSRFAEALAETSATLNEIMQDERPK